MPPMNTAEVISRVTQLQHQKSFSRSSNFVTSLNRDTNDYVPKSRIFFSLTFFCHSHKLLIFSLFLSLPPFSLIPSYLFLLPDAFVFPKAHHFHFSFTLSTPSFGSLFQFCGFHGCLSTGDSEISFSTSGPPPEHHSCICNNLLEPFQLGVADTAKTSAMKLTMFP